MSQLTKELFMSGAKFMRTNDSADHRAPIYQYVKSENATSDGYIRVYEGDTRQFHACVSGVTDTNVKAFKLILGEPVMVDMPLTMFRLHEENEVANG
jgi:hypothetical protein